MNDKVLGVLFIIVTVVLFTVMAIHERNVKINIKNNCSDYKLYLTGCLMNGGEYCADKAIDLCKLEQND